MLLPAANVLPVSADIGVGAVLIEPLAVALHAVARAEVVPGAAVAVLGAGMIGLGCAWAALQAGAEVVYLTDFDIAKTELGERLGARGVRLGEQSLPEALARDGREHVDRVVDAVGLPATLQQALDVVGRGGVVSLVGMGAPQLDFAAYSLTADERAVAGSFCYTTAEFAAAVALVEQRRLDAGLFIDRQVTLDKAAGAFAQLAGGAPGQIKTVVLPNG
jgi:threonine dehydrogenase-like Zn-dependent dehydrogenase